MSLCSGSACLLVLLGVVFASGSPVHFLTTKLNQAHESIKDALELAQPEIVVNPLFNSVIESINNSCQRKEVQLLNVTLDVYMRIFSSILESPTLLDQVPDPKRSLLTSNLTMLQKKTKELKSHLRHPSHNIEDVINKLNKIKVDDPLVQRKALAEFREIYQAASVIGSPRCGAAHSSSK